jgi:hypothetical protein
MLLLMLCHVGLLYTHLPLACVLFRLASCGLVFTSVDAVCLLPYLYMPQSSPPSHFTLVYFSDYSFGPEHGRDIFLRKVG